MPDVEPYVTSRPRYSQFDISPKRIDELEQERLTNKKAIDSKKAQQSYYMDSASPYNVPINALPNAKVDTITSVASKKASKTIEGSNDKKATTSGSLLDDVFNWVVGIFSDNSKSKNTDSSTDNNSSGVNPRPKLTQPETESLEKIVKLVAQMNRQLEQIQGINNEESLFGMSSEELDIFILFILVKVVKEQVRNKKEQELMHKDDVFKNHEEAIALHDEVKALELKICDQLKESEVLGWVQFGTDAALIAIAGVAGILFIASYFTPAAPITIALTVFGAAGALGSIGSGGLRIYKADKDQTTREQKGKLEISKNKKDKNQDASRVLMQEWKNSMNSIPGNWKSLSTVIQNRNRTSKNMIG